ncbi:MAG: NfeD family protein [Rhodospirillaceae bacterium]|nr:NfeD family protein [Rhodospirillaceae bacterium]
MGDIVIPFWYWWIAAAALLVLEMIVPGVFFLWLGVAAGVVGALALAIPDLDWRIGLLVFAALSVATVLAYRAFLKRRPIETDLPTLNRRGEQYLGRTFALTEAIVNGVGRVRVGDSTWQVEGPDTPAGRSVRVVGADGTVLRVERADE